MLVIYASGWEGIKCENEKLCFLLIKGIQVYSTVEIQDRESDL